MKKTADQIIAEVAEVLCQASGEFIEKIANQVLTRPVKYVEDSFFEQDDGEDEVDEKLREVRAMHPDIGPEEAYRLAKRLVAEERE